VLLLPIVMILDEINDPVRKFCAVFQAGQASPHFRCFSTDDRSRPQSTAPRVCLAWWYHVPPYRSPQPAGVVCRRV
jgi:hypothetical protein